MIFFVVVKEWMYIGDAGIVTLWCGRRYWCGVCTGRLLNWSGGRVCVANRLDIEGSSSNVRDCRSLSTN